MDKTPKYIKDDKGNYYTVGAPFDIVAEKQRIAEDMVQLVPWRDVAIETIKAQFRDRMDILKAELKELENLG